MTSVASSVVLATTMPLWVALASPFTTGDPLTPRTLLGVGVAIVGAAVIGGGDGLASATVAGNMLALVSAMTNGAHRLVGRVVRERVPLLPYVAVVYPTAAVALVLAAVLTSQRMDGFVGDTYLWMVLLALGPQVLGHSLYNWALGRLTAITVTSGIMTEPVFSIGLASVVLRDVPTATQVAGAALVLVGVFITVRAQQAAAAQAAAVPVEQPA